MTKLYHPDSRAVREVGADEASRMVKLNALKRAGFRVGELPDKGKALPLEEEVEALPATEGEEEAGEGSSKEPVMAEHASVGDTGEGNPFAELSMKELREIAKENEIVIPFKIRKKVDIAALLHSKLDLVDEDEEEPPPKKKKKSKKRRKGGK